MFWPFETGISVIDLPSGRLSGCDKGITSSSTACLGPVNRTGCILSPSFIPEGKSIFVNTCDEVATYFGYRDEQRHLLIVTERYLVGSGTPQGIASGRQNLLTNSSLGFRLLGQFPENE